MTSPINPTSPAQMAGSLYASKLISADKNAGILTSQAVKKAEELASANKEDGVASAQQEAKNSRVLLSPDAEMMARLMRQLKREPPIDEEKVAKIKAQIAAGDYKLDTLSLAREIIRIERLWAQAQAKTNKVFE